MQSYGKNLQLILKIDLTLKKFQFLNSFIISKYFQRLKNNLSVCDVCVHVRSWVHVQVCMKGEMSL